MSTTSSPAMGQSDSVTTLLQGDHERLDVIVEEARRAAASGDFEKARGRFAEVCVGLDLHIDAEEQVLFPAFEGATGMRGGPTSVMRSEHAELRRLLGEITTALEGGDAATVSFDAFTGLIGAHNHKEEQVLYPMIDRVMGPRLGALVGEVQAAIASLTPRLADASPR